MYAISPVNGNSADDTVGVAGVLGIAVAAVDVSELPIEHPVIRIASDKIVFSRLKIWNFMINLLPHFCYSTGCTCIRIFGIKSIMRLFTRVNVKLLGTL